MDAIVWAEPNVIPLVVNPKPGMIVIDRTLKYLIVRLHPEMDRWGVVSTDGLGYQLWDVTMGRLIEWLNTYKLKVIEHED